MSGLSPEQRIRRALDSGRVKGEGPFLDGLNALDELEERLHECEYSTSVPAPECVLAERLRRMEDALRLTEGYLSLIAHREQIDWSQPHLPNFGEVESAIVDARLLLDGEA